MGTVGMVARTQYNMYILPKTSEEEFKVESELYSWKKATDLVAFHASGEYVGADGKFYQMSAEYADDSTKIFPKVQVTVTDEDGNVSKHCIDITKVDTGHATEIEMFALCSHADTKRDRYKDIGNDVLSTWESLLFYREMAMQNEDIEQNSLKFVSGKKVYNWRDMIGDAAETYMDDEIYDQYLNVNRMKDMLDYYSRFEGRPDAFEDSFHAIRDYEFIRVLSFDNNINIEIYDKQKKIVCTDISPEVGHHILWVRELSEEELQKAIEVACSSRKLYMEEYSFWDEILRGKCQVENYETYIKELRKERQVDNMSTNCPEKVKEALEYAEEKANFYHLESKEIEKIFVSTTVESAMHMAKKMIANLEEMNVGQMTERNRKLNLDKRAFYYRFLEYLDPAQKYDPMKLLLKG